MTPEQLNAGRISALFHVFEGAPGAAVAEDTFKAASRIAAWHLGEARRFLGELALPSGLEDAARLEAWLIEYCHAHGTDRVPATEVQRFGPRRLRDKTRLDAAFQDLEALGRAQRDPGRRRKGILVNPSLLSSGPLATAILAIPATPEAER